MLENIVEPLTEWYRKNKRSLPWRDQNNAYYTWVSEIMLQQTRVEAVKPYFTGFIKELPDIEALRVCPEDKLMKLWEGLGYYNRVRNMQKAAAEVTEKYKGRLPADYGELLSLTGIGSYTAGAIASIAYGIPVPAVDGNVLRVISRITENSSDIKKQSVKKQIEEELLKVMPKDYPGDFNQALMELGAVVCVPNGAAKCKECPINNLCLACIHGTQEEFPKKGEKKSRRIEERTILILQDGEKTAISRRPDKGLLAGLYEFPNIKGFLTQDEALRKAQSMSLHPLHIERAEDARHVFSHVEWRMMAYKIRVDSLERTQKKALIFIDRKQWIGQYAIPSAFRVYTKYLKEENNK
ncbi:MAG: A/G-specific adenine glycosylase [Eubacteriales bacterium]|nr:A/G-specific adenine glycosylase [Eubacteriales bacterium]